MRTMQYLVVGLFVTLLGISAFNSIQPKHIAQQVGELKNQIPEKQPAHTFALLADGHEKATIQLTEQDLPYAGEKLPHQIEQKKIVIDYRTRSMKKLLWDTVKITGAVALLSLAAYRFLGTPLGKIEAPMPKTRGDQADLSGALLPSLTDEDIIKYRVLYNELGAGAIVGATMGATASLIGLFNPFGAVYFVTSLLTGAGSLYYRDKLGPENVYGRKLTLWDFITVVRSFF